MFSQKTKQVYEEEQEAPREYEDLFASSTPKRLFSYRSVLLLNDSEYIGTTNALVDHKPVVVLKTSFINEPVWKSYVQLAFYIRKGNGINPRTLQPREPTDLQKACVYMNNACIRDIQITQVEVTTPLPDLTTEKQLGPVISRGKVYLLTITYDPKELRQEGFISSFAGDPYPEATQIRNFVGNPSSSAIRIECPKRYSKRGGWIPRCIERQCGQLRVILRF